MSMQTLPRVLVDNPKRTRKKVHKRPDIDHILDVMAKHGIDPFGRLAHILASGKLDEDTRLEVDVLKYLCDHIKAKPRELTVDATVKHSLADILAGLGAQPNP